MAANQTVTVNVVVNSSRAVSGMNSVRSSIRRTETAAEHLRRSFSRLNSTLAILGGATYFANVLTSTIKVIDKYKELGGRLKLVTGKTADLSKGNVGLIKAQKDLNKVALETYTSYDSVGTLYARLGLATKDLGVNHEDLLDITQTVANSLRLSGASSAEAASSMLQLSQAMASGRLAGDEFRSISENNVALMQLFAKASGLTRGELLKLSRDQKLTTEKMVEWIKAFKGEYIELVKDFPVTVGRAMTNLKTQWQLFVVEVDKATGATKKLAEIITILSQNLDIAAIAVGTLIAGFALSKLAAIARGLWGIAAAMIGIGASAQKAHIAAMRFLPYAAAAGAVVAYQKFDLWDPGATLQSASIERLRTDLDKTTDKWIQSLDEGNTKAAEVHELHMADLGDELAARQKITDEAAKVGAIDTTLPIVKTPVIPEPKDTGITGAKGGASGPSKSDVIKEMAEDVARLHESLDPVVALWGEYDRNVQLVEKAHAAGAITTVYYEDMMTLLRDRVKEASEELANQSKELQAWEKMASHAVDSFATKFADALVDGIVAGKVAWRDFAFDFLLEINKMIAKQLIMLALQKALGIFGAPTSFLGGLFSGGFATGGTIPDNSFGIVGENGPEFVSGPANVTSTQDTASILQGLTEAMKQSGNVRIINVTDESAEDYLGSDPGEQKVMNIIKRNGNVVKQLVA